MVAILYCIFIRMLLLCHYVIIVVLLFYHGGDVFYALYFRVNVVILCYCCDIMW